MTSLHWLQRRKGLDRQLRAVEILSWSAVVLMLLAGLMILAWMQPLLAGVATAEAEEAKRLLVLLLLIGGLSAPLLLAMVLPVTRAMRAGIGVEGDRVRLRLIDGRTLSVAPGELHHSRCCLHHGRYTVPLRDRRGRSLFAEGELEQRLEPLLVPASALTPWQGIRHQWTHRDPALLWPLASVALLLALLALVIALIGSHPGVFAG